MAAFLFACGICALELHRFHTVHKSSLQHFGGWFARYFNGDQEIFKCDLCIAILLKRKLAAMMFGSSVKKRCMLRLSGLQGFVQLKKGMAGSADLLLLLGKWN